MKDIAHLNKNIRFNDPGKILLLSLLNRVYIILLNSPIILTFLMHYLIGDFSKEMGGPIPIFA